MRLAFMGSPDFAVPALRALRRALPGHRLVLGAPAWLEPIAALTGVVDAVHPVDGAVRLPDRLDWPSWAGPVDVAVNLHGAGPVSHQLLATLHPHRLVAFAHPDWPDGPPWQLSDSGEPVEHQACRWVRLVQAAFRGPAGVAPDDYRLAVPAVAAPADGAVVIHPGAAWGSRRWPVDRYVELTRAIAARGVPVVVTGGSAEVPLARAVAAAAGLPDQALLAGRTTLPELASLVAHARLVVSADTGVAHLATAYGTPSVVLFGPVPPAEWGPPAGAPQHAAIWHGRRWGPDYRGEAFSDHPDPGLTSITVGEVLSAARRVAVVGPPASAPPW
jgi:ADP-heptose:LPS heptosyltransferase